MQKISYVIPCYRSQHTVGGVVAEIAATMQTLPQYDYEVILVNDCSPDDTFGKCKMCAVIAIEPGCSIGPHAHGPDAELYYVLEGRVTVAEKGEELVLEPGDAMMVGGGESHFAENRGAETVRLLAVVMN